MRTGGYTLQQSLTAEAATLAKQAVSLARRRGHAQVTPLHVATVMFASSNGLFRRACLQSHSHPLQSKALELCFNVALNRLPTSTSNPILAPHHHSHHPPSLSNALVAAFKRAQAHQRRGSSETQQQQQPILALKIDIEQLVISILDDPSVSRVMREAGFSSTQVKSKVELAANANVGIRSHSPIKEYFSPKPLVLGNWISSQNTLPTNDYFRMSLSNSSDHQAARNDDVMSIINTLTNKKTKNIVIVGECLVTAENVVRGVIDKFDSGNVPGEMQSVQFISVPLYTLRHISREEFETKLGELRSLVKSFASRGVVLYLGDLKWMCEFWSKYSDRGPVPEATGHCYSPVEHMVMELSRLSSGFGGCGKLWIMGTANFQTYMKCKSGNPSLETLWELHPVTIPVGSLALGLSLESDLNNHGRCKAEGSTSWFHGKARDRNTHEYNSITTNYTSSTLPAWLQKYKEDKTSHNLLDQEEEKTMDLCSKWKHNHILEKDSPASSASVSSNDSKMHLNGILNWQYSSNFETNPSPKEQNFFLSQSDSQPKLDNKPVLLSNPNSSPNSASSSEASADLDELLIPMFKRHNQENMEIISSALENVVPWQKDVIYEIVDTILKCRSGTTTKSKKEREDTWLFFSGADSEGKEKIAKELGKVMFGSQDKFFNFSDMSLYSTTAERLNDEEVSNKRKRNEEEGKSYFEVFANEMKENPSRIFFIQDVENMDYSSKKSFKNAIDYGCFNLDDGQLVLLKDVIVIFSRDNDDEERDYGDNDKVKEIKKSRCSLDLNVATDDYEDVDILSCVDKTVVFKV